MKVYLVSPSSVKLMTAEDIIEASEELCRERRKTGKFCCGRGCPLFNEYSDCCGNPSPKAINAIFDFAENSEDQEGGTK